MKSKHILNMGIFAHVDAGKTTITENILFESGAIAKVGRVDDGNTQTDQMSVERRRGISVKATATSVDWNRMKINIIDTPGHGDFIGEVQRSMIPLDGAVLVVSAKEGVQPYTLLLFDTLRKQNIPTIIFVNKIDRAGVDLDHVVCELQEKLSDGVLPLQQAVCSEGQWDISPLFVFDREEAVNRLSLISDDFTEGFLAKPDYTREALMGDIVRYSRDGRLYPLLFGSALKNLGVDHLLNSLGILLPANVSRWDERGEKGDDLSAVVFKIARETGYPKMTYLRLYRGTIHLRQQIGNEKVTAIYAIEKGKVLPSKALSSGDIGIVIGLNSLNIGDIIGSGTRKNPLESVHPTLRVRIIPRIGSELGKLSFAVSEIAECDPFLKYELDRIDNELYVCLFGNVQKEILKEVLETQYGVCIDYEEETLIYKETVAEEGEYILKMLTDQNPYPATVGLRVEPNEQGKGVAYRSHVSGEALPLKFQHGIEEGVRSCLKQGNLGWEFEDIIITLISGKFIDGTIPTDFKNVSPMVFMEAAFRAGTRLMWPVNRFELKVPESLAGRAMGDLARMKARFDNPVVDRGFIRVTGTVPAELSRSYDLSLISYSGGTGYYTAQLDSYRRAPDSIRKGKKKILVDPLNRGKYLLFKKHSL